MDVVVSNETLGNNSYMFEQPLYDKILQTMEGYVILPLGILGNMLIIFILSQKKNRQYASSVLFVGLAVSDMINVASSMYQLYLRHNMHSVECKISIYSSVTSMQVSSWLLVAVATERVIGVLIPHKAKYWCTPTNASKVVAGIVFPSATFNICLLESFNIHKFDETTFGCEPSGRLQYFIVNIYPIIDCVISVVIPIMFIAVTSIIIVHHLRKMGNLTRNRNNERVTSVTRALLSANIVFMVTMTPFGVFQILYPHPIPPNNSTEYMLQTLFLTITHSNAVANFYLYFLSGPRFRADVARTLKACWNKPTRGSSKIYKTQSPCVSTPTIQRVGMTLPTIMK